MHKEVISTLLGYTSLASWLCAQIPQMLYTWRRKSVDGLALSLLANWFLGDATNLIGCILTDQLPFQTYIATYFVFIDVCLVSQFLHYATLRHTSSVSVITSSSARQSRPSLLTHPPLESHKHCRVQPFRSHSVSCSIVPSAAGTDVMLAPSERPYKHESYMGSEMDQDVHAPQRYRRGRGSRRANSSIGLPESVVANTWVNHWRARRYTSLGRDDAGDGPSDAKFEATPNAVLRDAFHSDSGGRGRGRGKHVSCSVGKESPERHKNDRRSREESQMLDKVETSTPLTKRGRQLTRPDTYHSALAIKALATSKAELPCPRQTSAASTMSASASPKRAGMAFLAVFVLFGFSSHVGTPSGIAGSEGRVLSIMPRNMPSISLPSAHLTPLPVPTASESTVHLASDVASFVFPSKKAQQTIGRVSAWTCTSLYITSRLPQIWKNFARKSVEGLSMYLFFFAFLGNFFYVLSILTNPKMDSGPHAGQFIRDSVPYLLGSGGTLIFDIMILLQSLVYDPRRAMSSSRTRRKFFSVGGASEEERRTLLGVDSYV